jgi:hypothetical protein
MIALKSKCYSFKTENLNESKKCKGTKRSVLKKEINFEDYKTVLFNGTEISK